MEATESIAGDLDCVLIPRLDTSSYHLNILALVGGETSDLVNDSVDGGDFVVKLAFVMI